MIEARVRGCSRSPRPPMVREAAISVDLKDGGRQIMGFAVFPSLSLSFRRRPAAGSLSLSLLPLSLSLSLMFCCICFSFSSACAARSVGLGLPDGRTATL